MTSLRRDAALQLVRTPVVHLTELDRPGLEVWAKDETKQYTGAYKARGVLGRMMHSVLMDCAVVAASSGNHGIATALMGRRFGRPVHVFVPATTPTVKIDRISAEGATITRVIGDYADADAAAREFASRTGAEYIASFDDMATISAQRRLYQEAAEDIGTPDAVFVPVGGGGGLAAACTYFLETTTDVVGAELVGAAAMRTSLAAGHRVSVPVPSGVAEGLAVRTCGALPFLIVQSTGAVIEEVTEAELHEGVRILARAGIRAETSAAASIAALARQPWRTGLVLCVVTGGNIDEALWSSIVGAGQQDVAG